MSLVNWLIGVDPIQEEVIMEWTDEFITNAQHELTAMVQDWKYDYGADDRACVAMLLWMVLRLKPDAEIDPEIL